LNETSNPLVVGNVCVNATPPSSLPTASVRRSAPAPAGSGVGNAQPGIGVCDELDEAVRHATLVPVGAVGNAHFEEVVVALVKLSMTIGVSAANAVIADATVKATTTPPATDIRRSVPANGKLLESGVGLPMSGGVYCRG
jgi:hypothetical protein